MNFHGHFDVKFVTTIRSIFPKVEILYEADLKAIELEKRSDKKKPYWYPLKRIWKKIKLKDVELVDLVRIGIRKKTLLQ